MSCGEIADVDLCLHQSLFYPHHPVQSHLNAIPIQSDGAKVSTHITRKARRRDHLENPTKQIIKPIRRIVNLLQIFDRLYSGPKNERWQQNRNTEVRFLFFDELPDSLFSFSLGDAVGDVWVVGGDCV